MYTKLKPINRVNTITDRFLDVVDFLDTSINEFKTAIIKYISLDNGIFLIPLFVNFLYCSFIYFWHERN